MQVKAHKLEDVNYGNQWFDEILDRWEYRQFLDDDGWRKGWVSMDTVFCNDDGRVYLGITSFDADIFRAFDPKTGEFLDLGYSRVADPYDAKFHRSLVKREKDGCLYAAIALLHDIDRYWEAPGGSIVRYNPKTGDIKKLGIPLPHMYIQSICLDEEQDAIYGFTFTPERMFRFNLADNRADDLGPISSGMSMAQGENIELDDEGCVWCCWTVTRAWQSGAGVDANRFCKYDPRDGRIHYLDAGLPNLDGSYGYTKAEGIFHFGKGRLYASGANGSIYRVDKETGMGTLIGTPIEDRRSRLASLKLGPDGAAYGITGRDGKCEVIRFDPETEKYELLGPVVDGDDACWQVHDCDVASDGTIYAGENDNPYRSAYLWEIKL